MFCFQRRFSRPTASTSIIKNEKLLNEKLSNDIIRMKDENSSIKMSSNDEPLDEKLHGDIANEESVSSPIKFIDQEMSISESSSTDTLPGIKADYLDTDPLSINSSTAPLATLEPTTTTTTTILKPNNGIASYQKTNGGWRKKFLLYLRSDSTNSDANNSSTSSISSTPSSLSSSKNVESTSSSSSSSFCKLPSTPLIVKLNNETKIGNIKTNSSNDIRSLNGFSEDEQEDDDVIIDDDDDDDDDDNVGDDDDEEDDGDDEEEDDCCETETENEEGSSLPSSPAVVNQITLTPNQVPYYSFLSVNGGSMRQEVTSTSSPQLSSVTNNLSSDDNHHKLTSSKTTSVRECLTVMNLKKPDTLDSNCLSAARSCPNLEQQSIGSSTSGSSSPIPSPGPAGPRFKPLEEGDIQVCYLNHTRTLVSKILSSKFLRRWETHHLYLNDACLSSKTPTGFLQQAVPYSSMSEVYTIARWDPTYKYCLRIVLPDGSLLLQASNAYTRDQWYHSILWKKSIFKYQHLMSTNQKEEIILKELKALVDFALWTPLQDERINGTPLEVVAKLLDNNVTIDSNDEKKKLENGDDNNDDRKLWAEAILTVASPLLEKAAPPPVLARVFAKLTEQYPTSSLVTALMPAITRCLKHTVDFGKSPDMRKLIQVFIAALYENDNGEQSVRDYIRSIHGFGSDCPHPRILPNLVSICVAAIFHRFDVSNVEPFPPLDCYLLVLKITSEYADWRPGLSALLQPVPFPENALSNEKVQEAVLLVVMRRLAQDSRCSVHRVLLPVREPRPGWIHIAAPSSLASPDDGTLFGEMLTTMLGCCCRRKKFISSLLKHTGSACILLGVRGCDAAQEALCLMLEWRLLPNEEAKLQVVSALQSTKSGKERYSALCQRQRNLQELQQKGGPKKLTLPVRATDADVALLLDGGAHGNLECLSLAFTSVTSACAEQLIKLPALRYLNLWATQFGDTGLQMISEHLQKLQVLNLCETPVSDKGISTLVSLTNLRKLNLNSTKLSAQTFESLKKCLPALQEFDVRYTEAW